MSGGALNMFTDAFFTPICLDHLTAFVIDLVAKRETGILHVAGGERQLTPLGMHRRAAADPSSRRKRECTRAPR